MPRSIRVRFIFISILIPLMLGLIQAVVFWRMGALLQETLEQRTTDVARTSSDEFQLFLTNAMESEQDLGRDLAVSGVGPEQCRSFLTSALSQHSEFQSLAYLSGKSVAIAGDLHLSADDIRSLPSVQGVMNGRPSALDAGMPGVTEVIQMAVPSLNASGERDGVVLGIISHNAIAGAIGDSSRRTTVSAMLIDSKKRLVFSNGYQSDPEVRAVMSEAGLTAALSGVQQPGRNIKQPSSDHLIASFAPVRLKGQSSWAVVAVDDMDAAVASLRAEQWFDWKLFGVAVILGLLAVWWQTGTFLLTVKRLQRAAQAVASGDIGYRVHLKTGTDMDTLVDAFNNMAVRLQEHHDLLRDRNQQLNVLLKVVEGLRPEQSPEDLLRHITQEAAFVTFSGVAFLALVLQEQLVAHEWWNGIRWQGRDLRCARGQGVCGWVWLHHETLFSSDDLEPVCQMSETEEQLHVHSYVCAPIVLPNGTIAGVLFVGNKAGQVAFSEDDVRIMELLARHAGVALEVQSAFMRERQIGATLQRAMLPDVDAHLGGLSIAREYQAATAETELGGDFYDVISLPNNRLGLVIADVSGKGLQAAVQTASVKYALRAYVLENSDPSDVLRRLNHVCCTGPPARGFVSIFYGVLDLNRWELCFANGGHLPPLLRHAKGDVDQLPVPGIVLGVMEGPEVVFPTATVSLEPGDTLVLYTDGISEARHGDDFLDTEGLQGLLRDADMGAHETACFLLDEAMQFAGGVLHDDVALLVVRIPDPLPAPEEVARLTAALEL